MNRQSTPTPTIARIADAAPLPGGAPESVIALLDAGGRVGDLTKVGGSGPTLVVGVIGRAANRMGGTLLFQIGKSKSAFSVKFYSIVIATILLGW